MSEMNEDTVRAEARAWLEANWNPDYGLVEWRLKLAESKPFKGGRAVVGKGADQLPVVVSVIRKSIGLDHRPVRQVLEKQVWRVHDSVLFLNGRAAAQRNIAAARDRVTADIGLSHDQDHRGTGFPRDYGRREPSCSRTDHHDVRLAMPLGRRLLSSSGRRARGNETASGQSRSDPSAAQK